MATVPLVDTSGMGIGMTIIVPLQKQEANSDSPGTLIWLPPFA